VLAGRDMSVEMRGHCLAVRGDQDAIVLLRPLKYDQILGSQGQFCGIARANDIEWERRTGIVTANMTPQYAALILVQ
jgi:hypothetical protein